MADVHWTLWVFAGPEALTGLIRDGDGLAVIDAPKGEPIPLALTLARTLGGEASLPEGVRILAEVVGTPTLLQELTGEWPTARLVGEPRYPIGELRTVGHGERDLQRFVDWAEGQTPAGSRRALIVLGDVLRAIGDVGEPFGHATGPGRPTYPSKVVIRKKVTTSSGGSTEVIDSYTCDGASPFVWRKEGDPDADGLPSNRLLQEAQSAESVTGEGAFSVDEQSGDDSLDAMLGLKVYSGTSDADTSNRSLDVTASRNRDERAARRVDAVAAALRAPNGTPRRVDLLATDDRELSRLVGLRGLAAHAEVLVGSPGPRPIATQPLVDLLESLVESPQLPPEVLAEEAVTRSHRRARLLERRAGKVIADASAETDPRLLAAARSLVFHGWSALAVRGGDVPAMLVALDAVASTAMTLLDSSEDASIAPALRRGLDAARARGGDLGGLTERLRAVDEHHDGLRERTVALERAAERATISLKQVHDPVHERPPMLGICLDETTDGERSSWASLLDTVRGGRPEAERRALQDVQGLASRSRQARRRAVRAGVTSTGLAWLEYGSYEGDADEARAHFERFLRERLGSCPARHVGLIVRGATTEARPASIVLPGIVGEALPITELAQCLREALSEHGREPLAMLVLDDPALLTLEIAYELRDVTHVLAASVDGARSVPRAELERLDAEQVGRCEARAVDAIAASIRGSVGRWAREWRRGVAKQLADELCARLNTPELTLVGIDLRFVEALCRRFDRVCQILLDSLDDGRTLAALEAGAGHDRLIALLNHAQVAGLYPYCEQHGWTPLATAINDSMNTVYWWVRWPGEAVEQGGAPFWIGEPPHGRDEREHSSYLRIRTGARQPRDYRELSFHQDVRLHALLASWRLVRDFRAPGLWDLVSLGLAYAPAPARRAVLERLAGDANAAHYFTAFGPPPLLRLDIEQSPSGEGYELRLGSDESTAVLVRRHSVVDLSTVDRTLDGLGYVLSKGAATRQGWSYLESLGSSLAEDVIAELYEQLERERTATLETGRSRDAHLALVLPRELMRYPWELMLLPSSEPDQPRELLAERFALGRQMWSDRGLRRVRRDDPIRALIIGDPRTDGAGSLAGARAEAQEVASLFESMTLDLAGELDFERDRDVFIGTTLTRAAFRRIIREGRYDVVHFAGHGTYDSRRPDHSGWLLSDGLLTATELRNTLAWTECPPWLIFANACDAGMMGGGSGSYLGDVHGMADACIRVGVNAYVGPLWKIDDESARMLAAEMYRNLLLRRSTIGAALRDARGYVRKTWEMLRGGSGRGDISWAGMVLFGNPTERINETAGPRA